MALATQSVRADLYLCGYLTRENNVESNRGRSRSQAKLWYSSDKAVETIKDACHIYAVRNSISLWHCKHSYSRSWILGMFIFKGAILRTRIYSIYILAKCSCNWNRNRHSPKPFEISIAISILPFNICTTHCLAS